tara:strand:+ start:3147 stop:4439 length:1293 start_codon:yes stop_codon:yes gene_type:complete
MSANKLLTILTYLLLMGIVSAQQGSTVEDEKFNLSHKMSINMKNSDIRNVLELIGELTGLNIVISPEVQDTVTANLENVSVRAALDAILQPNGYSYFIKENILIIKLADTQMVGELETQIIRLKYIDANMVQQAIGNLLSPQGRIVSYAQRLSDMTAGGSSNRMVNLILTETQENMPRLLNMINTIDVPIANINIAVKFIETQIDTTKGSGFDWTGGVPIQLGGNDSLGTIPFKLNNVTIATLNPIQLSNALRLMQARGNSKLLSSPSVTTLDNHPANVDVTTTVYIEGSLQTGTTTNNQENTSFPGLGMVVNNVVTQTSIGISLMVTPRLNETNRITLAVDAEVEALLAAAEIASDRPRSTSRSVKTQVTVQNGDTVILGGLIAENTIENFKYFPGLRSIPIIGRLFQSKSIEKEQRELLIFITPNVVG